MTLMAAVLSWDFRGSCSNASSAAPPSLAQGAAALNRPGVSWSEVLLAAAATEWLLPLLQGLRACARMSAEQLRLAAAARGLVAAYCNLAGDVFPPAAVADTRQASKQREGFS